MANEQKKTPTPEGGDQGAGRPEMKQGVITADDTAGRRPRHWRVPTFRGSYKGIGFDDDGFSDQPVPEAIADEFRAQFKGAEVEEVAAHAFTSSAVPGHCKNCGRAPGHSLHVEG